MKLAQLPRRSSASWALRPRSASRVSWTPDVTLFPHGSFSTNSHFTDIGAAYGTAKSGVGIASMGVMHPGLVMKNIIPVVMAGVLGIYGLIVAVIIQGSSKLLLS